MQTLELFKELSDPRVALKAAIAADTEAAGGVKAAAAYIWPKSNKPLADEQRLRNAGLPGQKQLLDYFEIQRLKYAARLKSGASHIHALESKALDAKLQWVTLEEQAQEATVELIDAATVVTSALAKAQSLIQKIAEAKAVK